MRGILILFMDDMRAIHCRDEKTMILGISEGEKRVERNCTRISGFYRDYVRSNKGFYRDYVRVISAQG